MADPVLSWLDARPSARVVWLQWRNLWRRWPLGATALVCVFVALGGFGRIRVVAYALALAALSPRVVLVVTTVFAATLALRHRRRLENNRHRHWLAALPHDLSFTTRTAAAPVAAWLVAAVLVTSLSLVARLPAWVPARVLGWCAGGVGLGVALAAAMTVLSPRRGRSGPQAGRALVRSRYVVARGGRRDWASRVSLRALGSWPRAETQFRDRPSSFRGRSLVLLLLLVPMGASGGAALVVAAAWLLIMHMINLLLALARAAFGAAWWLAPTPLGPVRFTAALAHRNFAAQIGASALLFAVAYVVLGASSLRAVCAVTGIWLGAVAVLGAAVCVAALRTRSIAASALHRWRA